MADTDLDALLPCPWCGGKPSVCKDDSYGACSIICGSCDTGPDGAHRKKEELDEAIKVWNTRARLAPPSAQQVTQEAWRALSMIREVVEQMGVGLMPAGEHTLPPTLAREAEVIVAALARLAAPAPPTHADDEALLSAAAYSVHPEDIRRAWSGIAQRLAELRARAETAERALAECRAVFERMDALNITKEEYIMQGPGRALKALREIAGMVNTLKKEPRDA